MAIPCFPSYPPSVHALCFCSQLLLFSSFFLLQFHPGASFLLLALLLWQTGKKIWCPCVDSMTPWCLKRCGSDSCGSLRFPKVQSHCVPLNSKGSVAVSCYLTRPLGLSCFGSHFQKPTSPGLPMLSQF